MCPITDINARYKNDIGEDWLRDNDPEYSGNKEYMNNDRFRWVARREVAIGDMDGTKTGKSGARRHKQTSEWYRKQNKNELFAQLRANKDIEPKARKAKTRKEMILNRLESLPGDVKKNALLEFEAHEYFARNEGKHIKLINDAPHKLLATDLNGDWVL